MTYDAVSPTSQAARIYWGLNPTVVVWLDSAQPPLALSPFGHDRSPAVGWDPGLLRYQANLPSHRGRQRYRPARKTIAKRMARGVFRNFVYFRTAAYLRVGQLNLDVSNMS
jgi:hypothetical protein